MMKKVIASALAFTMFFACCVPSVAASPLDNYPGIDELPQIDTIPNPFQFFDEKNDPNGDGYVSTVDEWDARRDEIKDLVQHYWLGYKWPTAAKDVEGSYQVEDVPNTVSFGGFFGWGATTFNLGDEFNNLMKTLLTEAVTVNGKKYGPAADEAQAQALAIQAWNAGYTVHYAASMWTPEGDAALVDSTGMIDETSIPKTTKPKYTAVITITNPDRKDEQGQPVTASFNAVITPPTEKQLVNAWGSKDVKVPFVINIGGSSSAFSAKNLNEQGYALLTFTATDIYPDTTTKPINRDGVYTSLYPYDKDQYEYASGAMMAWAWGCTQIITAMENKAYGSDQTLGDLFGLDPARTVVTGHSRYGKAAMFAAAFDERISICVPSEPGGSGIQSNRYKVEGKIFNFNAYKKANRVYGKTEVPTVSYGSGNSWFPETAAMFVAKDNQFPFDSDEIIALVAPRPFYVVSGIDAHWLGNEGGVASVAAAAEVYEYIGQNETEKNNIAVQCRESDHVFYPRDFCFALSIMDREFKQSAQDNALHVKDLFPKGAGIAGMSFPAADYANVSDFNYYPFDINSSYMPWSSANKYMLWTAQENFLTAHDVTITAHSDAPDVDLYLPDGVTKIDASSHDGEVFTFNLTADQSIYGRYELRTDGNAKDNRSVFFAAVSLSDSLRHGTTKGDEGEENRVLGFSSRLANTKENPPLVYVGGSDTPETMCFTPERMVPEATSLLEYGILFHDNLFIRIATDGWDADQTFNVKNLKFVTIPDYTFEFSMADIAASAENSGKQDAGLFTKPISWNVEKYNNGPAKVWPAIPDTLEERALIESGQTFVRPDAPEKTVTDFKAQIIGVSSVHDGDSTAVTLKFSEPLRKQEYAVGLDVAEKWNTTWNDYGDEMTLTIADSDFTSNSVLANIIIFRLMDLNGNLISGPVELTAELDREGNILDRTGLQLAIDDALALKDFLFTPKSYAAVKDALALAKQLAASDVSGGNLVTQEDIDAAAQALDQAINNLVYISSTLDWSGLQVEIDRALALDPEKYTEESYANVDAALKVALALKQNGEDVSGGDISGGDVSSGDIINQYEIDAVTRALRRAISTLKERPVTPPAVVDKAVLKGAIDTANALDVFVFTDESYNAVYSALQTALQVYSNPDATQEEVNAAAGALKQALSALVQKPYDGGNDNNNTDNGGGSDTQTPSDSGNNAADPNKKSPKTYDDSYSRMGMGMLMFSLTGLAAASAFVSYRRKRR